MCLIEEVRKRALSLSASLKLAKELIQKGQNDTKTIQKAMQDLLLKSVDKLDYVAIVDREFNQIDKIKPNNTIILVAAFVGKTRLIDNIWV